MFDFERLTVYSKAKSYNFEVSKLLKVNAFDHAIKNQLRRSSLSIVLNIAEGSGRNSRADKRNFFIISRGSCLNALHL